MLKLTFCECFRRFFVLFPSAVVLMGQNTPVLVKKASGPSRLGGSVGPIQMVFLGVTIGDLIIIPSYKTLMSGPEKTLTGEARRTLGTRRFPTQQSPLRSTISETNQSLGIWVPGT